MNTKGFTLIEVLIGLFIALMASIYVSKTITSTNRVVAAGRDTFIATNLAHDGIDLTRAMRDNTWFMPSATASHAEWMSQSGICENTDTKHYTIDPKKVRDFKDDPTASSNKVNDDSNSLLYIDSTSHLWGHDSSGTPTKYKRVLEADCTYVLGDSSNPQQFVTITSTVSWTGLSGEDKSVSLKEQLYNWF